ncbi:MAG: DUF1799 domain-containing protein [Cyanobium sp. 49614_E6]|jgi:hypothetical protein|nr:DUF1799 domain-containing protein [Cyanobium sp. 49614_E6]MCE2839655.1 DUF1799 domain-containing protein [Cyanobium sp. 49614_E6]
MERNGPRWAKKNLQDAARFWLNELAAPTKLYDSTKLAAAATAMGLAPPPAKWIEQSKPPPPREFLVWPENWPAVELFMRCQTQWRHNPVTGKSLAYEVLLAMGRTYKVKNLPAVIEDVQVMEYAIISEGSS